MGSNKKIGFISFLFSFIIGMLVGILEKMRYNQGYQDGKLATTEESDDEFVA